MKSVPHKGKLRFCLLRADRLNPVVNILLHKSEICMRLYRTRRVLASLNALHGFHARRRPKRKLFLLEPDLVRHLAHGAGSEEERRAAVSQRLGLHASGSADFFTKQALHVAAAADHGRQSEQRAVRTAAVVVAATVVADAFRDLPECHARTEGHHAAVVAVVRAAEKPGLPFSSHRLSHLFLLGISGGLFGLRHDALVAWTLIQLEEFNVERWLLILI